MSTQTLVCLKAEAGAAVCWGVHAHTCSFHLRRITEHVTIHVGSGPQLLEKLAPERAKWKSFVDGLCPMVWEAKGLCQVKHGLSMSHKERENQLT